MTTKTELQKKIHEMLPYMDIRMNEPMSRHTSFRIGGDAEIMVFPRNEQELSEILHFCQSSNTTPSVLGAGTNILAPDEGVRGIVICLKDCMNGITTLDDNRISVMAGVTMTRAAVFAAGAGLSGFEFAHGIPGSVGGGVYMNAGAYGGDISQICENVDVMDLSGKVTTRTNAQMKFGYRHSILETAGGIVIRAVFRLEPKDPQAIWDKMRELMAKRSASQPLDRPSAGSAFKRPVGGYAAALIQQAGLKGFRVGNAGISEKHAGFAVNLGGATAADMKALLAEVAQRVYEDSGIRLEPEIRIW